MSKPSFEQTADGRIFRYPLRDPKFAAKLGRGIASATSLASDVSIADAAEIVAENKQLRKKLQSGSSKAYTKRIKSLMKNGKSRAQAVETASRELPEGRRQFLKQTNPKTSAQLDVEPKTINR